MKIYKGKWYWAFLALFDTGLKKAIFVSVKKQKNLALRHITRIFRGLGVTDMVSGQVVFSFKLDEVIG